jgi:hypothetical protein
MRKTLTLLLFTILAVGSSLAAAQGGLESGTQAATNFRAWFYGFVGICAGVYIVWEVLQLWAKRNTWTDLGTAIAQVAAGGAAIVLADWAWATFV